LARRSRTISDQLLDTPDAFEGMASQSTLAKAAGLSRLTVNKALKGDPVVSAETRQRVIDLAQKIGYRPSATARAMRDRRTRNVGVLFLNRTRIERRDTVQSFLLPMITGLNAGLESAGYQCTLMRVDEVMDKDNPPRLLSEHLVDGLVVLNATPTGFEPIVHGLNMPTVWVDHNYFGPTDCLRRDEYAAGRAVIAELHRRLQPIGRWPEKIVFVGGYHVIHTQLDRHYSEEARERAVADTTLELGTQVDPIPLGAGYQWDAEDVLPRAVADKRISAGSVIVCSDTIRARTVERYLLKHRLIAGLDYSIASLDDGPDIESTWPQLLRCGFDRWQMGHRASALVLQKLIQNESTPSVQTCDGLLGGESVVSSSSVQ
jgi:DNA-binding LacI/PurR family transcriptional regulator